MYCKCGGKTKVIETRCNGKIVYRRRKCIKCGNILFTEEKVSDDQFNTRYMIGQLVTASKEDIR